MKAPKSRKSQQEAEWPRKVEFGRFSVTVYRRIRADGRFGYEVANYSTGKRRLDSYPTEEGALAEAAKVARQLSTQDVVAASMTNEQAAEYASAVHSLAPYSVSLPAAAGTLAECLKLVGGLTALHQAAEFYVSRHKKTERKRVADVVADLLKVKTARGASKRYRDDIRNRLELFAEDFKKDICDVSTKEIQAWLDGKKRAPQTYMNYRRLLYLLFEHAVARGCASENPVEKVESLTVRGGETEVFTPSEIAKLLAAAAPGFVPSLAIGAFAGLRSAEVERLEWADVHLAERHLVVTASNAKTASRRIVPIAENLAEWLAIVTERKGKVWKGGHDEFYEEQQAAADAAGVKWKANGLRHSYASYRCAQTGDAGRVAGELGNSAAVVHRHYRELVKPADADLWFAVRPQEADNVIVLPAAACA